MKRILTIIFLLSVFLASAQDYKLFHAGSKKLFTNLPAEDSTYSIGYDSVRLIGGDSVYYNYTGIEDNWIQSDSCMFWGGPYCQQQNKPSWIGSRIISGNDNKYIFLTAQNDSLNLNFDLILGDSALIYQDVTQKFYLVYEGADTTTILGIADSARYFRISHQDASGIVINSALNNKKVIIGKIMGLAQFFRIDLFPQILQAFKLVGNTSPAAGLSRLTNEMLYDHQPGDVIQYCDMSSHPWGPPELNYTRYIKHIFLSRNETQDSLFYSVARIRFDMGSTLQTIDTIMLKYKKSDILAEVPYDKLDQGQSLVYKTLQKTNYCGLSLWTYTLSPGYLMYCADDNCWGSYDTQGPPAMGKTTYVCGLGLYIGQSSVTSPPPAGYSSFYGIVYFKKNGIICGNEEILGISEPLKPISHFSVFPNPAGDNLFIKTEMAENGSISMSNLQGQEILNITLDEPTIRIDISGLNPGIYLLKMISGRYVEIKKIVKD
jgi:hypothetical protein